MKLVEDHPENFLGISYFQYQVAYWKGGSEMAFGVFGLGDTALKDFQAFGQNFTAWCLDANTPDPHGTAGATLLQAVQTAYGGQGVDVSNLCVFNPKSVP